MKKLNNSLLPTPLHKLAVLSKIFLTNIYCKRDDMTGVVFGGNKTRKLDYLIYEAKRKRYNTLVTTGGFQSNFCRLTAAYGSKEGFEVHFVLGGKKKPKRLTANLLLMTLLGAKLNFIETENWTQWEEAANKLAEKLIRKGRNVYQMPIGGSNETGILGYVDCFDEIMNYSKKTKINFDYIIHATGSSGTQSGLLIGKARNEWKGKIIGVSVAKDSTQLHNEILDLSLRTAENFNVKITPLDIIIDDSYIGGYYGAYTEKSEKAVKIFAKKEGIMLDYVYTGKAAAALLDYCRNGKFLRKDNVLFIHTGGNIQIFK